MPDSKPTETERPDALRLWSTLAGPDAVDGFEHHGWHFLCSGEQRPGGGFHAVVRCRLPPADQIRTLRLGRNRFDTASAALAEAKAMALRWADDHTEPDRAPHR